MYTYTTPTIPCTIKHLNDWTQVEYVRLAIQGQCTAKLIRVIPVADISIETLPGGTVEGHFDIKLTQEETAQLKSGMLGIQARIKFIDDTVLPTNAVSKRLDDVIDKVVI